MPGIYIHIPFCIRKCAYCDFVSFTDQEPRQAYLSALKKEISLAGQRFMPVVYDTVFIGGGTPSILSANDMAELIEHLNNALRIAPDAEFTIECNPGTVDREKLLTFRLGGVNRISFGLQSSDDSLLRAIGRIHDFAKFKESLALTKEAGFTNANVDLMYGLPGQSEKQYLDTIREVTALEPTHISAYSLILEEGTPLYGQAMAGEIILPKEDEVADMQDKGRALLSSLGYERYEISNYAKPGYACRHNINYWGNGPYLGMGLAAHSAMDIGGWRRWYNYSSMSDYIGALDKGALPIAEQQSIPQKEEMFECLMLGLRMLKGVDREAFLVRFGQDVCTAYLDAVEALVTLGWAEVTKAYLRLTNIGLDMENSALLYFLEDKETRTENQVK